MIRPNTIGYRYIDYYPILRS